MDLLTKTAEKAPETEAEKAPAVDAVIHVSVAADGMEAALRIDPPENGGAAPTLQALESALSGCGVCYNIDGKTLRALADKPVYGRDTVVARGLAPEHGADGTVSFLFSAEKRELRPRENENGQVDYHDLGLVENVAKGQVLCRITPPTPGAPGITVTGKVLLQKRGKPAPSYAGKNTALSEDGAELLAQIEGQVEMIGRKVQVNDTFMVKENVDASTGDLKVAGNLVVRGMVQTGFKLEAGNRIDVYGTVQSGSIRAGGDVRLRGGITGGDIYCEGDLQSRFLENCNVFVKGEIRAEYVLNSNIKCGKTLKTEGNIAKILGGRCLVGQNVVARTIGSAASVRTKLELGTDPGTIERQQELSSLVPELEKQLESLKPLLELLRGLERGNRLTPEKKELLHSIAGNHADGLKMLEEAKTELLEITRSIREKGYGRVICTDTIYPGVSVTIGSAAFTVSDILRNTSLYYEEGEIRQGAAR